MCSSDLFENIFFNSYFKRHEQVMNLPEIEVTVHVIRVLEVAVESRDLKIAK